MKKFKRGMCLILKGNVLRSEIAGCIQMKSFVPGGAEVKISLSEDFFLGASDSWSAGMFGKLEKKLKTNLQNLYKSNIS